MPQNTFMPIAPAKKRIHQSCIVFSVLFLFNIIWIWQGFDMTDEGYLLENHRLFYAGDSIKEHGLIWLSDLAGGIWQNISGGSIIMSRVGWALLVSLSGVLTFILLASRFSFMPAMGAIFCCQLFCSTIPVMCLSYDNFTMFLALASSVFLFFGFKTNKKWLLIVSGFFAGLCPFSKISAIIVFFLPFLWLIGNLLTQEKPAKYWLRNTLLFFGGALLCFTSIGLYLHTTHRLNDYCSFIRTLFHKNHAMPVQHSPIILIKTYVVGIFYSLIFGALPICMGFGLYFLQRKRQLHNKPNVWVYVLLTIVLGVLLWIIPLLGLNSAFKTIFYFLSATNSILGIVLVLSIYFLLVYRSRKVLDPDLVVFLLMGLFLVFAAFWGSNTGIVKATIGCWVAFPLVFLIIIEGEQGKRLSKVFGIILLSGVLCLLLVLKFNTVYRDNHNRFLLKYSPNVKKLECVLTTSGRANCIDSLYSHVRMLSRDNDTILAFPDMPMLYYLTNTIPALGFCWLECFDSVNVSQRIVEFGNRKCKLIVVAKASMTDDNWGSDNGNYKYATSKTSFVKKELVDNRYMKVWENSLFEIYQ